MVKQQRITVKVKKKGCHLITNQILEALGPLPETGLVHLFLQHTSAAITINENHDPAVLRDFEAYMERIVPRDVDFLTHTIEGPDDMPSHVKMAITGFEITLPITGHKLGLGQWQGIWLCEYRDLPRDRNIILSVLS